MKSFKVGDRVECIQPHMVVHGRVKELRGKDLVVINQDGYDRIVPVELTQLATTCECIGPGDTCRLRLPHMSVCACECHGSVK